MDISEDSKVSPRKEETLKVEPGELLEEGWFFGNLLDRKTRIMSRCFSDPSPSSKVTQGMLVERSFEETYSSINKKVSFPVDGPGGGGGEDVTTTPQPHSSRCSLMRTPSMPSPNRSNSGRLPVQTSNTTTAVATNNRLKRTPSLPAMDMVINNNIEDEEESDYSMGRLIRQASLGQSNTLPPRQHTPKKLTPSTIPKQHYPRRKPEQEGTIERRRQQILRKDKIKNTPLVETKQAKDFKGSDMDSLIKEMKMLPKLQEEKIMEEDEEEENYKETIKVRKPYVPEARRLERTTSASPELRRLERTTSASPVLDNIVRPRTTDDMKAQIKFWARAVASNVR